MTGESMKILVYGGKGWIGSYIIDKLSKTSKPINIVYGRYIYSYGDIEKDILEHAPDRIWSFVGRTGGPGCNTIDYLEDKLVTNINDNLYIPLLIMMAGDTYGIHVTYMGTGCIFSSEDQIYE